MVFFNLKNLIKVTENRESCVEWCILVGLLPEKRYCSKGKHWIEMTKKVSSDELTALNRIFKCNKKCGSGSKTAAEHTWFEFHRIPIEDVLLITYGFVYQWSYDKVQHEIAKPGRPALSTETIADIFIFCREVIMDSLDKLFDGRKIGGSGKLVQIDEIKYGHWKHHRSRFVDGVWIFGCIECESKEIRLEIIPDNKRTEENMIQLLKKHVDLDSVVVSDKANFYHNIKNHGFKDHKVVNRSAEYVNEDEFPTNRIESIWKNVLGVRNTKGTLDYHLCEFIWRKHVKTNNLDPFLFLIQNIVSLYPGPHIPEHTRIAI